MKKSPTPEVTALVPVIETKLDSQISPVVQQAKEIIVSNPETFALGSRVVIAIDDLLKQADTELDPNIEQWHKGHKAACAFKKKLTEPLINAKSVVKGKLLDWKSDEDRKLRLAQAKIDDDNRRIREANEAKARKEIEKGNLEKAKSLRENVRVIEAPVSVVPNTGFSIVVHHKARVINPALVPDEFWILDQDKLNSVATMYKGKYEIPGVEFYTEETSRMGRC